MITIRNRDAYNRQLTAAINRKSKEIGEILQKKMREAQLHARSISPVYSGDFASNWNVSVGKPDVTFISNIDYTASNRSYTREKGFSVVPEPVTQPWGVGNFSFAGFTLGSTVYLSNSAEHDEPYAFLIEENRIAFRPVNQNKDAVRAKTAAHIVNTWGYGV